MLDIWAFVLFGFNQRYQRSLSWKSQSNGIAKPMTSRMKFKIMYLFDFEIWIWLQKIDMKSQMRTSQFMAKSDWLSAKCKQNPAIRLPDFWKRCFTSEFWIFRSSSKNGRGCGDPGHHSIRGRINNLCLFRTRKVLRRKVFSQSQTKTPSKIQ